MCRRHPQRHLRVPVSCDVILPGWLWTWMFNQTHINPVVGLPPETASALKREMDGWIMCSSHNCCSSSTTHTWKSALKRHNHPGMAPLWPVEIAEEVSIVPLFFQYNVTCVKPHYNCRLSTNFPCSVGQDCSLFIMCALIEFPVCLQTISGIIS